MSDQPTPDTPGPEPQEPQAASPPAPETPASEPTPPPAAAAPPKPAPTPGPAPPPTPPEPAPLPRAEVPAPAPTPTPEPAPPPAAAKYSWGTGRRKTSVARVRLRLGEGKFLINGREVQEYFPEERDRNSVVAPLQAVGNLGRMDIFVNVHGGGLSGQAGAVLLGVARALRGFDSRLEAQLREGGYLTRDSRMVERKKYGQRGARRRFQFSKR